MSDGIDTNLFIYFVIIGNSISWMRMLYLILVRFIISVEPEEAAQIADRNGVCPIHNASEFSSSKIFQYLVELDDGRTVDNLLDANKDSIFHYTCRGGNLDVIQCLLEYHSPLVASSSVSVNTSNKVPNQLLLEAGEEKVDNEIKESTRFTKTIWRLLLMNPETVMMLMA